MPSNLRVLVKNFPIYATAEDISAFFKPVAEILLCHTYFDAETRNFVMNGTVTILFYCEITCEEFVAHPLVLYDKNRLSRYHVVLGQSLDRVFEPGSCVKVNATKGDFSRADVWLAARRSSHIAAIHVEYREGWKEAWIRFCTAEDAQEFAGMVRKIFLDLETDFY